MKLTLLTADSLRLDPIAGPLVIEAASPELSYSPFHMLGGSLAYCSFSVLHSWATQARLNAEDLSIEVQWAFAEDPHRVGHIDLRFAWPSLPANRLSAAKRVAEMCTVHATLQHPPTISIEGTGSWAGPFHCVGKGGPNAIPFPSMRIETLAARAGHGPDADTGAVTPAIHLSTTFEREPDGTYRSGYIYSRYANPNRAALETALATLEGGAFAAAFASGSAATMTLIQAIGPGSHIVAPDDAYFGTTKLMRELFGPWGVELSVVDMTDLPAVEKAMRPNTRLVWMETPSNPLLRVVDIGGVAEIAKRRGALSAVDNTWGTPVLQRPLELGVDVVMHSTTKYLGGHSDVLGGVLVCKTEDELAQRVRLIQATAGAVPSPFECWLTLRGIRTLPWRVRAQCASAGRLATYLAAHEKIEAVHYPGLPSHPGHAIARKQMSDFGGMLSVQVGATADASRAVASSLKLFTQATSLGGTESLIEHRASVEGPTSRSPQNLLRVSVGLEHIDDLLEDWETALR